MRCVIAGSRSIKSYFIVSAVIRAAIGVFGEEITEVVSGRAPGVDRLGERWATENQILVTPFPADWTRYKLKAGPIRNEEMAQYAAQTQGGAILVWDGASNGTHDMWERAVAHGLKVHLEDLSKGRK